jgi:hypothetical protein
MKMLRRVIMAEGLNSRNAEVGGAARVTVAKSAGRSNPPRDAPSALLEVENIKHDFCLAIHQHNVAPDHQAFTIARRGRQAALEFDRNRISASFQAWRKRAANYELTLQAGWQTIPLRKTGRKVTVVFTVPDANLIPIVAGKAIAATVVSVVVVFPFVFIVPVPAVPVLSMAIRQDRTSRNKENCDRN